MIGYCWWGMAFLLSDSGFVALELHADTVIFPSGTSPIHYCKDGSPSPLSEYTSMRCAATCLAPRDHRFQTSDVRDRLPRDDRWIVGGPWCWPRQQAPCLLTRGCRGLLLTFDAPPGGYPLDQSDTVVYNDSSCLPGQYSAPCLD